MRRRNWKRARREQKEKKVEEMNREQITLRVPPELKEALQEEAQRKGISFNSLVCLILRERIEEFHRGKPQSRKCDE